MYKRTRYTKLFVQYGSKFKLHGITPITYVNYICMCSWYYLYETCTPLQTLHDNTQLSVWKNEELWWLDMILCFFPHNYMCNLLHLFCKSGYICEVIVFANSLMSVYLRGDKFAIVSPDAVSVFQQFLMMIFTQVIYLWF